VSQDEEGGFAFLPALVDVRAARFLAHGVEVLGPHDVLELGVVRPGPSLDAKPLGTPAGRAGSLRAPDGMGDVGVLKRSGFASREDRQIQAAVVWIVMAAGHRTSLAFDGGYLPGRGLSSRP